MLRTLALSLFLVAAPALAQASNYEIDPMHSSVSFAVKHMMVTTVRGEFTKVQGSASWNKPDFSDAAVEVTVDAGSISTRVAQRDAHLKSPDFFDVAKFPTLTFKSKRVEKGSEAGHVKLVGDLTMHGVTKEVTFDVTGPTPEVKGPMGTSVGAAAVAKINREDFGLKWNKALEAGGVMVGKDVTLEINLEMSKKALKASK
jgi:polyisoprenoid-binding protein YceI